MEGTVISAILLAVIQIAMCSNSTSTSSSSNSTSSSSNSSNISPDPIKFFPHVKGDLTKLVWAHAVNNQKKLIKMLDTDNVMMLEADVTLGRMNNSKSNNQTNVPIMAHPPATESDLSLDDFLTYTTTAGKKGIKLDFKSAEAFNLSKSILERHRANLTFPVFLNADILSGPINPTAQPLNGLVFMQGAKEILPNCTLSVGWTTSYEKKDNIAEARYTAYQINKMIEALLEGNVSQPVTYPVRANFAANDINVVKKLLANTTFVNATLTIWSPDNDDSVNATQLSKLIQEVGLDRVYLDVPESLRNKLFSAASTMSSGAVALGVSLVFLVLSKML